MKTPSVLSGHCILSPVKKLTVRHSEGSPALVLVHHRLERRGECKVAVRDSNPIMHLLFTHSPLHIHSLIVLSCSPSSATVPNASWNSQRRPSARGTRIGASTSSSLFRR